LFYPFVFFLEPNNNKKEVNDYQTSNLFEQSKEDYNGKKYFNVIA
jgi:hypothetical protein